MDMRLEITRMTVLRELAKFGCGVAAMEAVVHASLLANGLTITMFGITLTGTINVVQTILPALVALALGIYAWRGREPEPPASARPAA